METLTLEQIYFLSQTLAAIAVVITLIYLGFQVKQNTEATQVNATQAFVDMFNTLTADIGGTAEMADIVYRGINDYDSLNQTEVIRFNALWGQQYRIFESAYQQWKRGALDEDVLAGLEHHISDVSSLPGTQKWCEARGHWYGPEIWKWVDTLKVKHKPVPMYEYLEGRT